MVGFCYFRSEANVPTYPFYNIKRRRGSEEGSRGGFVLEFYHALVLRSSPFRVELPLSENAVQSISTTRHSLSQTVAGSGLYFLCMCSPFWLQVRLKMPPRAKARARGKAKAQAKARAVALSRSNARRDRREGAVRVLNALAGEVHVSDAALAPKTATGADFERLVKLLEGRLQSEAQFARLHSAAQQWSQNGGKLTVEVLPEDTRASPFVVKHRVLAACFKLKRRPPAKDCLR